MAKKPDNPVTTLKWVIKCLEALRDSLCQAERPRGRMFKMSFGPPAYDAECPPPSEGGSVDVCAALSAVIIALKKVQRQVSAPPFAGKRPNP